MYYCYLISASIFGLVTTFPIVCCWFEAAAFAMMGSILVAFISGLYLVRLKTNRNLPMNLAAIGAFAYCAVHLFSFLVVWLNTYFGIDWSWIALVNQVTFEPLYTALNIYLLKKYLDEAP